MVKTTIVAPQCLLCQSETLYWFSSTNQGVGPSLIFEIYRCSKCKSTLINPVPENLDPYYSDYHSLPSGRSLNRAVRGCKNRLRLMTTLSDGRQKVLDIGAGSGGFVAACLNNGIETQAIEINSHCREYIKATLGVDVSQDLGEYITKNLPIPNFVTLWHVFEHIPNPDEFIKQISLNFGTETKIIIEVPNSESWQFLVMRAKWPHLDVPRHIFIPSELGIQLLAKKHNLKVAPVKNRDFASWSAFGIANLGIKNKNSPIENILRRVIQIFLTPFFILEPQKISATRSYVLIKQK